MVTSSSSQLTTTRLAAYRRCPRQHLCLNSVNVNPDVPPPGFERLADVHPEPGDSQ